MKPSSLFRVLTILATLPAWVDSTPAHAQGRGGYGRSGGNDAANVAGQILRGINQGLQQQQGNYPRQQPPLGGSSLGGLQGQRPQYPSYNLGGSNLGGLQNQRGGIGATPYINPSNMGGMSPVNNFNNGGLSDAFGQQPQYQQPQQYQNPLYQQPQYQPQVSGGPNPGQPYQIPAQYANYSAGTVINWGQYRYQLGSDGTMTSYTGPAQTSTSTNSQPTAGGPTPGQRYQIPAQYAGTAPGTQVNYGGNRYIANNDGTMTAFTDSGGSDDSAVERISTGPVPGQRYQIPAEHAGTAPGAEISYGGNRYVANTDGTMTAMKASSSDDPFGLDVAPKPAGPVLGKRYQIPAEHANTAPGSLITYGGNSYVANDDGTMTAFKSPE
ncbi:hypothetical protein SAMN05444166_4368 [Singulisphaera sp. GP187]|uniref:hypothetical protein n=1 Tax=Singulisphaera sp. GP187 TaxID=1882752 RepID=UPI00092B2F59|nr:hypothetical protein [Singulisphaera sp. GP187]SIO39807.1 hypothetical protein SAMN05444166_4368 [Singulisphaera sp. GP187]